MAHELGHSEFVDADGPLDTSGSKNPLQQYKSTRTYLKKESYTAITGIASGDSDDDGNKSGGEPEFITEAQDKAITKRMKKIYEDDGVRFLKWMEVETVDTIPANDYKKAIGGLSSAEKALA